MNFILIPIIIIVVIFVILYNTKKAKIKRALNKIPQTRINQVREGDWVKIIGEVGYLKEPMIAPISERPCTSFQTVVERSSNDKRITLIEEEVFQDFYLKSPFGWAIIKTDQIHSYLERDAKARSHIGNDTSENLEAYLNAHHVSSTNFVGMNKNIHYYEGILEEGEKVAVLGKAQWLDAKSFSLPEGLDKVLLISADQGEEVIISDMPAVIK